MKYLSFCFIFFLTLVSAGSLIGYPLDGIDFTGIKRLEGIRLAQQGVIRGPKRVNGAKLPLEKIDLRLTGFGPIDIPQADPELSAGIRKILGEDAKAYSVALLDISNGSAPRFGVVNPSYKANAGSVGKLAVVLGIFQALADISPEDEQKRIDILRNTMITADEFILSDHHKVPFWNIGDNAVKYRPIKKGDIASLWTYLDWMMSASSNAAAAMVQKEMMLMNEFGSSYPPPDSVSDHFFKTRTKKELKELFAKSMQKPFVQNGLNLDAFRQGSFFTWNGKKKVAGTTSYATSKELIHYLLKLEQGLLVDTFSSREIKRLMYMTGKRIRYASSPALYSSAVYFKSGSLYKCRPEPEFKCRKYQGNVLNQLCSVAIIEHPASEPSMHYFVAVMSNVLKKNSAVAHQTLATRLHRLLENDFEKKLKKNKGNDLVKE